MEKAQAFATGLGSQHFVAGSLQQLADYVQAIDVIFDDEQSLAKHPDSVTSTERPRITGPALTRRPNRTACGESCSRPFTIEDKPTARGRAGCY
jgi:hypothetical protein